MQSPTDPAANRERSGSLSRLPFLLASGSDGLPDGEGTVAAFDDFEAAAIPSGYGRRCLRDGLAGAAGWMGEAAAARAMAAAACDWKPWTQGA